ncbi:DUF5821 family protein [Halorubrum rutilum]|uniref:DUF5821 family protein n=1 Tax=Halorubrum rutilum TaxID=1364933 RepID=A0ABD6AJQ1_9EURY|nr:DUF5821 family protein [Halorubrum rutilum]
MPPEPTLPFADGRGAIGDLADPVLADPSPPLLTAVIEAYREAAPAVVEPDLSTLRGLTSTEGAPGPSPDSPVSELPTLTVLATDRAIDAVVDEFRRASRLAALAEAGVLDLRTLSEPQPNPALVGRETGHVLVAVGGREDGDATATWCRVGDDPALRERYVPLVEAAEGRRPRAPSRRRVYESVRERCGVAVADDVVRAFDAGVVEGPGGDAVGGDPLDLAGARRRAYVAGARRGALDRDLRRAFEDAGLGSSATFTRVKRKLRESGLLGTESVPQPVGRPRERLVARGALAEADGPGEAVAAAATAVER